jgi:hypothetical protein
VKQRRAVYARIFTAANSERYPGMKQMMITADGGGSNGSRVRLFKRARKPAAPAHWKIRVNRPVTPAPQGACPPLSGRQCSF